ncbi:MAG: hypothetical protein ACHQAV_00265 [Solirubrobacterales bacterium]
MQLGAAAIAALAVSAPTLALAAPAQAAIRPAVSTGGARAVSFASATLNGSVNPNGSDTSYYFQYGLTRAYGGQTLIADAGAGTHGLKVSLGVAGLQPLTVYHYRLVGVNSAGASIGSDETLLTTKVPLSLAILATPNPVLFGGTVTVQGTLSGTLNANRVVVLQANAQPGNLGFGNVGNPELTTATGSFSFAVLGMAQVTQFRVVTSTNPPVISPVAVANVAVRVNSHVGRARRHGFARIFGTVSPAEDGMEVGVLRTTRGRGVLVGGTRLRHRDANSSAFSREVPVKRGVYRVLVRVTNGAQVSNYGQPLLIG